MGFDYNKSKGHAGQDSMWTSYSDLFLGLSIIFLLLYVSASLKQGTDGIKQSLENKRLVKEVDDLHQQIKVYENLKQNYLNQQASQDEQSTYQELMSKLDLLQDEQTDEAKKLRLQARENEKKQVALNKYQQLIRNIINSNMIAKSRIKSRDTLIDTKEEVINEKTQEITGLEQTVSQKSAELKNSIAKSEAMKNQLNQRMKQLRNAYTAHKISKQKYEQQQAAIKKDADTKLAQLRVANARTKQELDQASRDLAQTSSKLNETEGKVAKLGEEKSQLQNELATSEAKHRVEAERLKGDFDAQKRADRAAFEAKLAKEKISGEARAAREAQFKVEAERKAANLAAKMTDLDQKYKQTADELAKTAENLNETEGKVAKLGQEKSALQNELASADAKRQAEADRLKADFDAQKRADRAAFEDKLAKEKLSGDAKAAREAQFKADAERKAGELAGKMADLDKKYKQSQGDLAKANENLNARKKLAEQIKSNFAKYGVKADVDGGSGDVMLSFGDEYFASGHADLKPKMREILQKAMPAYSSSLFENEKIANKIQSVEIVGFASPTYKGKYVDPTNLDPENRQAVNYNLDLSYNRAKSIFGYVFDRSKMSFKNQERMLPLVKVTGRSFLAGDKNRDPATTGTGSAESFCRSNDCAKLQKVIIKFTLKD